MSFSFSFSGDDIDEDAGNDALARTTSTNGISDIEDTLTSRLQNATLTTTLIPPKSHTLSELLTALPSQISYNYLDVSLHDSPNDGQLDTPESVSRIPRRSLFDIRQQLMAESDPSDINDETGTLLSGLETGDLSKGIYEGGFKTWECSVDLAGFVYHDFNDDDEASIHVVEMGAGSAVPALGLLGKVLRHRVAGDPAVAKEWGKVRFTLCDYNEDVLRLGTSVNVVLTVLLATGVGEEAEDDAEEGEIDVDEALIHQITETLEKTNVEITFISGAWGREFVQILSGRNHDQDMRLLLLASETIYSPDSLHIFSQTVVDVLRGARGPKAAYIAAKKVYFGVGGGVAEFEEELRKVGGRSTTVLDVKSAGVGRVVLEVSAD